MIFTVGVGFPLNVIFSNSRLSFPARARIEYTIGAGWGLKLMHDSRVEIVVNRVPLIHRPPPIALHHLPPGPSPLTATTPFHARIYAC